MGNCKSTASVEPVPRKSDATGSNEKLGQLLAAVDAANEVSIMCVEKAAAAGAFDAWVDGNGKDAALVRCSWPLLGLILHDTCGTVE